MEIREIDWQTALPIRHAVLWPQKSAEFCRVPGDDTALHFGAYLDDELVAVASIFIGGSSARLRKFATLTDYQGQGIGGALLTHIIGQLETQNLHHFWCDARVTARGFYERFGLSVTGDVFDKSGVEYYRMSRRLNAS